MRRGLKRLSYAALVVTGLGFLPPVQARAKSVAMLCESLGFPFPRPFAAPYERREVSLDGVSGHLYMPPSEAPGIVLLPGAALQGKDDPRIVRAARSIARTERVVFVPDLVLAQRRLEEADVDRIVRGTLALGRNEQVVGRPSLLGFSYGGSFGLLAAADPRLEGRIQMIATFGAYFDLVGVIQAVTTGTSLVDGRRIPWQGHPRAEEVLRNIAMRLVPERGREPLERALDGEGDPGALPEEVRPLYRLLKNRDPARTFELAQGLPLEVGTVLRRFSPSTVASRIEAPIVAMHSTDDPAVPYGELIRLVRALPGTRSVTVSLFRHVDFTLDSVADLVRLGADAYSTWRFSSWVLSAQE